MTNEVLPGVNLLSQLGSKHLWLDKMCIKMMALFNNKGSIGSRQSTHYVQFKASSNERKWISLAIAEKLLSIALSTDSTFAAKEWYVCLVEQYAPLKIIFTSEKPVNSQDIPGLYEKIDALLPLHLKIILVKA